jgi:hypothetical protein
MQMAVIRLALARIWKMMQPFAPSQEHILDRESRMSMQGTMVRKNLRTGHQGASHMTRTTTVRIVRLDMCLRLDAQDCVFRAALENTQITTLVKLFVKLARRDGIRQIIRRTLYV